MLEEVFTTAKAKTTTNISSQWKSHFWRHQRSWDCYENVQEQFDNVICKVKMQDNEVSTSKQGFNQPLCVWAPEWKQCDLQLFEHVQMLPQTEQHARNGTISICDDFAPTCLTFIVPSPDALTLRMAFWMMKMHRSFGNKDRSVIICQSWNQHANFFWKQFCMSVMACNPWIEILFEVVSSLHQPSLKNWCVNAP